MTETPAPPTVDEINALKEQRAALRVDQATTTQEDTYDQLQTEIDALTKAISLAEARRRQAEREAAEEARRKAVAQHRAGLRKLEELQREIEKHDAKLFAALEELTVQLKAAWKTSQDAAELADHLHNEAPKLELPAVDKQPMTLAGMATGAFTQPRAATLLVEQYLNAWNGLEDARRRGVACPDKPAIDWYAKGNGQFWPGA